MGRLLAIDLGTRQVGLALSDPLGIIASPHGILKYRGEEELLSRILEICKDMDVEKVVVGYPFNENRIHNPIASMAERIFSKLRSAGIPAVLWDESFTSRMAEDFLRESGKKRKNSRDRIDSIAASMILKSYMENTYNS